MMWSEWAWRYPERVHALWLVVALVVLLVVLGHRGRNSLASLLSPVMQKRLAAVPSQGRKWLALLLVTAGLVACVLALMRPQARGKTETVAQLSDAADVMFVLDVSKSMLAEDAKPNRLTRAKVEVSQLASKLERSRVGLVAFAGRAVQVCPLTPDRSFFELVLGSVSPATAGKGGTRIGEAINAALRGFPAGAGAKLIILITDGEDQESYPLQAAEAARAAGVKIVAIGIGDEAGSQIVMTDPATGAKSPLLYDGKPVVSKLDGETLRKMALATDGVYIPAGTAMLDLASIMASFVTPIVNKSQTTTRVVPVELFPYLLLFALAALLAAFALGASSRRTSEVA